MRSKKARLSSAPDCAGNTWKFQKFFGYCDEISFKKGRFTLAFCAISLYNEPSIDYGGVCAWVN